MNYISNSTDYNAIPAFLPREKLLRYSSSKLTDSELLATIFRTGKKGQNVVKLTENILKKYSLINLFQKEIKELQEISGIGKVRSIELKAIHELSQRITKSQQKIIINSPEEIFHNFKKYGQKKKEYFIGIYLDVRNQEITREIISIGTLNCSLFHPREVFEPAIKNLASHIILIHNHPSGDCTPSDQDISVTEHLIKCGQLLGIPVNDHIIITPESFYSFKEHHLIA
ncbi:hypothetical protein A2229_01035 [Candidatus Peregrinibacteria bacterium RIFOXYA2_FULL_33_7]|nr:MAG: hypothetical protein A2229_01035 [Candidatus Peregrinibacteria bacterium RIFOXYA2_FULL_33_7]